MARERLHELRAVIGREAAMYRLAADLGTPLARLTERLCLLPWTDERQAALGPPEPATGGSGVPGLPHLHPALVPLLANASRLAPLAFVEAEAFDDGTGSQAAAVWERGGLKIAYGYGLLDPRLRSRTPVNLALEQLGVVADELDEFDTVRLGRHARTADWPVSSDA